MRVFKYILIAFCLGVIMRSMAQVVPSDKVIAVKHLEKYLKTDVASNISNNGEISTTELAQYFRTKFSERYFYNWKNFDARFKMYQALYPSKEKSHTERAEDHLSKYSGATQWELPFNYLFGAPVNAYALRHLARQHKMVDIAFYYNYQDKNPKYINYFKDQQQSLNTALHAGGFEKIEDGNGVYEAFRSGYRILNWLQIHNMFLGEQHYDDEDQLQTIATLLQHAAHLFERNKEFKSGNHQTRGLSALAMVAILLRDFKGADVWYKHAMNLLEEHLAKEINDDGFQFERTIHYHISDIGNYYYVYQLAKKSDLNVSEFWENKLKSLFTTLIKMAYPDTSAPVLSDDTDVPWAEKNDISGALTLGYVLFEDPEMGYFANNQVDAKMFWYLSDAQLQMLNTITTEKPEYGSLHFPITGYYIMRDGWEDNDNMMVISAGLDALKPDHQHGDMLGVQAMANGKVVLPNYQVRYYLKDLELFKNSLTKNVALVDEELQGKRYTSNKGGSGFGKFKSLPNPTVINWETHDDLDVFVGKHNGFEDIGVLYTRQIINLKNDFWIVKDNFKSNNVHTYKQVWQGHYSKEHSPNLLRATFSDGSGLDIYQLHAIDEVVTNGKRGKQWALALKKDQKDFSFITLIVPFETFDKRIDETVKHPNFKGWTLNNSKWKAANKDAISISNNEKTLLFNVKTLAHDTVKIEFQERVDVSINTTNNTIYLLNKQEAEAVITKNGTQKSVRFNSKLNNTIK